MTPWTPLPAPVIATDNDVIARAVSLMYPMDVRGLKLEQYADFVAWYGSTLPLGEMR